ncbi:hypothetical protein EVAR_35706_1 [Eumeta japonica]|uniref:Uncharacterized protein n=1 Tax=Eumeta variegata TaxID=151549 RepID=A0A4C1VG18_EUMVA|nr:hypothetical protein EVAR_35706_1 [Eumeta japonica]
MSAVVQAEKPTEGDLTIIAVKFNAIREDVADHINNDNVCVVQLTAKRGDNMLWWAGEANNKQNLETASRGKISPAAMRAYLRVVETACTDTRCGAAFLGVGALFGARGHPM